MDAIPGFDIRQESDQVGEWVHTVVFPRGADARLDEQRDAALPASHANKLSHTPRDHERRALRSDLRLRFDFDGNEIVETSGDKYELYRW